MPDARLRLAERADIPAIEGLIARSVRGLHSLDYSDAQIEAGLASVYGGDRFDTARDGVRLDPHSDAAKIRAFFVHPERARRGLATVLLDACEDAARAAGFRCVELGARLTGQRFFRTRGYHGDERVDAPTPSGERLPVVRMRRNL